MRLIKLSIMVLSIIALATGLTSILYIQTSHGSPINFVNGSSSLQSSERTATLIVVKNVTTMPLDNTSDPIQQKYLGMASALNANNFIMHVNGNNPSPFEFAGSESGTNVSIGQGPYAVTETKPLIPSPYSSFIDGYPPIMVFSANYSKDCTGTIKDGEIKICKIIDTLY